MYEWDKEGNGGLETKVSETLSNLYFSSVTTFFKILRNLVRVRVRMTQDSFCWLIKISLLKILYFEQIFFWENCKLKEIVLRSMFRIHRRITFPKENLRTSMSPKVMKINLFKNVLKMSLSWTAIDPSSN